MKIIYIGILCFLFTGSTLYAQETGDLSVQSFDGSAIKVNVSCSPQPTDLEGRLAKKERYYFFKLNYSSNFFSFNLPGSSFNAFTERERKKLVEYLLRLYGDSFDVYYDMFGWRPEGFRFNVTFGKNTKGYMYNMMYLPDKISNVFTDSLPYRDGNNIMSADEERIMVHEIGHSLFGIVVGTTEDPRSRAIEEGFVDYFMGKVLDVDTGVGRSAYRLPISAEQASRIKGLSQLDVDASVWGDEAVFKPTKAKGYAGITHHLFGLEFIHAVIDVFGKKDLLEFLKRFKQAENDPYGIDHGTQKVRDILAGMGYSKEKISEFENDLHRRLKENVFRVV